MVDRGNRRQPGGRASEIGAASLLLTGDGRKFVVAAHGEIPRLMEDGLGGLGMSPWS